jgi:D-inositol-3-phosphate glycosyltransferase
MLQNGIGVMSRRRLSVSVIEPVGGHSGMDYYDLGLCWGLAKAGVNVSLYSCDETRMPNDSFAMVPSYRAIYGPDPSWRRGLRYVRGTLLALLGSLRSGAEICHLHFFHVGPLEFLNVVLARLLGLRIVVTAHDVQTFVPHLSVPHLAQRAYRIADVVIAHNKIAREELIKHFRISSERIAVIPHGNYLHVIDDHLTRDMARTRLGLPPAANVLLFFGQIKEVKGLDVLLRALPDIIERHPGTLLVIAGREWKDDFSKYWRIVHENGLERNCVTHIRHIPSSEVPVFYRAADLVVLPYRKIYQSGVLLMAMSYEKPVLASDLPGMTEIVRDGETGFLFSSGSSEALSRKTNEILADPGRMQLVGSNGFRLIESDYSWQRIGELTAECYQSALEPKATAGCSFRTHL